MNEIWKNSPSKSLFSRIRDLLASTYQDISHAQTKREGDWWLRRTVITAQHGGGSSFNSIKRQLVDNISDNWISQGRIPWHFEPQKSHEPPVRNTNVPIKSGYQPGWKFFPMMLILSETEPMKDFGACSSVQIISAKQSMQPCCALETEI